MKTFLLALTFLSLSACISHHYQACAISASTGEISCGAPQDRHGAELKALAINAASKGEGIAWSQKVQKVLRQPKQKAVTLQDLLKDLDPAAKTSVIQ